MRSDEVKKLPILLFASVLSLSAAISGGAAEEGIRPMPRKKLIELAMSAAPSRISKNASIMIPGADVYGERGRALEKAWEGDHEHEKERARRKKNKGAATLDDHISFCTWQKHAAG